LYELSNLFLMAISPVFVACFSFGEKHSEGGKGFAVIAEELGHLSMTSTNAAKDIAALVRKEQRKS